MKHGFIMKNHLSIVLGIIISLAFLACLLLLLGFINFTVNPPLPTAHEMSRWRTAYITMMKGDFNRAVLESGYGDFRADFRVPFDSWIRDPQTSRNNCMNFFEKSFCGVKRVMTQKDAWKKQEEVRYMEGVYDEVKEYQYRSLPKTPNRKTSSDNSVYNRGYSLGWDVGYQDGVDGQDITCNYDDSGKSGDFLKGYTDGYEDGYEDGHADWKKRKSK